MNRLIILIISLSLIFLGCSKSNNENKTSINNNGKKVIAQNKLDNIETVVTEPQFSEIFDDLDKLVNTSEIIIEGEVLNVSYFDFNTVTRTKTQVKVTKTYNDKVKVGDILIFTEPGGITTKEAIAKNLGKNEQIKEEEKNNKVQILFMGAPLSKPGDKVLLFAKTGELNMLPEKYYVIAGGIQGKFYISGQTFNRFIPKELEETTYKNLKITKKEIEEKVKDK